jgi:hypothetical protein
MYLVEDDSSTFTSEELARLGAYRAAVAAGFYTDWDGTATETDVEALAWLAHPRDRAGDYPFTPDELVRLERCRDAVAAGYYAEDLPAESASEQAAEGVRHDDKS